MNHFVDTCVHTLNQKVAVLHQSRSFWLCFHQAVRILLNTYWECRLCLFISIARWINVCICLNIAAISQQILPKFGVMIQLRPRNLVITPYGPLPHDVSPLCDEGFSVFLVYVSKQVHHVTCKSYCWHEKLQADFKCEVSNTVGAHSLRVLDPVSTSAVRWRFDVHTHRDMARMWVSERSKHYPGNSDSLITSLPSAKPRTHKINAPDANAQWEFTFKLITLSSEHCHVDPHCNVM